MAYSLWKVIFVGEHYAHQGEQSVSISKLPAVTIDWGHLLMVRNQHNVSPTMQQNGMTCTVSKNHCSGGVDLTSLGVDSIFSHHACIQSWPSTTQTCSQRHNVTRSPILVSMPPQ